MSKSTRHLLPMFLAVIALTGCATAHRPPEGPLASLDVRELNIVDEHGQTRLRLGAPLPDPQGLKRKYKAVGLQLMNASGQEVGGLAMIDEIGVRGLCFDTLEGHESMCMGLFKEQPSLYLMVRGKDRISLSVDNEVAKVVLSDAEETPRMVLSVDKDGKTRVEGVTPPPEGR